MRLMTFIVWLTIYLVRTLQVYELIIIILAKNCLTKLVRQFFVL